MGRSVQVAGLTLYEAPDLLEVLLVGKPAQRMVAPPAPLGGTAQSLR